jgi:Predicted Zn-dependent protease
MSVIRTDKWLEDLYEQPIRICEKIKEYFDGAQAYEIYDYLTLHGMYYPFKNGNEQVRKLQENKVWEIVQAEKQRLQKIWEGPDVPVFIFPSDTNKRRIMINFKGKSGLAFKDKLFLFISEDTLEKEIRSLFTHEYNHVCRLFKFRKSEEEYVLLDTIILEGLAENAVCERFGEEFTAPWTSYHSTDELEKIWDNLVHPNRNILKTDRKHQDILYGLCSYPKMAGYCVGYYLVKKYFEANSLTSNDLLNTPSDKIADLK